MLIQRINKTSGSVRNEFRQLSDSKTTRGTVVELNNSDVAEVMTFLNVRPVHTVVMAALSVTTG